MAKNLSPSLHLLKAEVPINMTSELKDAFDSVNEALSDAFELAFKQSNPGKQLVLMTDASFRSAVYALMIEDNLHKKIQSKRKTYAPLAIQIKNRLPSATQSVHLLKGFSGILHGILRVSTHFARSNKTYNHPDRQQSGYASFPDQSSSNSTVECMWLCFEFYFQKNPKCGINQHCSWPPLHNKTEDNGEKTSQNPRRHSENTHWGDNNLLGCRCWRTVPPYSNGQNEWVRGTSPTTERTISAKRDGMGSKQATIHIEK